MENLIGTSQERRRNHGGLRLPADGPRLALELPPRVPALSVRGSEVPPVASAVERSAPDGHEPDWLAATVAARGCAVRLLEDLDFGLEPDAPATGGGKVPGLSAAVREFAGEALRRVPRAFLPGALDGEAGGRTSPLACLEVAVAASLPHAIALADSWLVRMLAWPYPGPLVPGGWRAILMSLLELRRDGRVCGAAGRAALEEAVRLPRDAVPVPSASGALGLAAIDVAWASRAKALLAGRGPLGAGAAESGLVLVREALDTLAADGRPGGLAAFFGAAGAIGGIWEEFESGLDSLLPAIAELAGTSAGAGIPRLSEAVTMKGRAFADFCLGHAEAWAVRAGTIYSEALDALEPLTASGPLKAAAHVLGTLAGALAADGSRRDASVARDLAMSLDALPDVCPDWAGRVPLAAAVIRLLKAPKPLSDRDMSPLENDFSAAFSRRFVMGEFDSLAADRACATAVRAGSARSAVPEPPQAGGCEGKGAGATVISQVKPAIVRLVAVP
ncbi:MAG: hypothetical protein LBR80_14780, partial [Deltaproteobacteria bacterium]|nr:hypothetical protein [Deltaproteobacteria bacterium]